MGETKNERNTGGARVWGGSEPLQGLFLPLWWGAGKPLVCCLLSLSCTLTLTRSLTSRRLTLSLLLSIFEDSCQGIEMWVFERRRWIRTQEQTTITLLSLLQVVTRIESGRAAVVRAHRRACDCGRRVAGREYTLRAGCDSCHLPLSALRLALSPKPHQALTHTPALPL